MGNGGNIAELRNLHLTTSNYTCIIHICTSNIFLAWQVCNLSLLTHPKIGPLAASVKNFTTMPHPVRVVKGVYQALLESVRTLYLFHFQKSKVGDCETRTF